MRVDLSCVEPDVAQHCLDVGPFRTQKTAVRDKIEKWR
jgi:hypothetical protein